MTTQQPEAMRLAEILEGDYCPDWLYERGVDEVSAELHRQHARITELEAQLAQRFDAADMATAAAQGFRDGATAPAQPVAEPSYEHQRAIMEGERNASLDAYSRVIYLTGAESQLYEAGFTNGWQRASHRQAPAGATEPTEQQILEAAEKAGLWPNTVHSWIQAFHRYHKELAKAQPAPAQPDSELEDAARLDWLLLRISGAEFRRLGVHYSGNARRADVDAARKQGVSHDR